MRVYPAIDLQAGKAVYGPPDKPEQTTVHHDDPISLVAELIAAGVERLHIVDRDALGSGRVAHRELIAGMVEASSVPVQVDAGIRDPDALGTVLSLGVKFAVIGTAALENRRFARKACHDFAGRIIVAVDADSDGQVRMAGWSESGQVSALELAARVSVWGAAALLYTDITRVRADLGPDAQATVSLAGAVDLPVIATGVRRLEDVHELALADVESVVVGAPLYDGRLTLAQAIAAAGVASAD